MPQNSDNHRRTFADVVSIDAWHNNFTEEKSTADLHVDVVFGTARLGGESDAPVRFRLSIRNAEIVVVIPNLEPISVDRRSVARDTPDVEGLVTETRQQTTQLSTKGALSSSLSPSSFTAALSIEAAGNADRQTSKKIELSEKIRMMIVTQSQTADGDYRWSIAPRLEGNLKGRPWDASKEPRLKLIDQRKDRSKGLPPIVQVEIRCRREDLAIEDLQIKDASIWQTVRSRFGFKNRMAAAESYIRDRLAQEKLEVRNLEDAFGQITLGSVTAKPE